MTTTFVADVANQVQKFWSPIFQSKMKEETILPSLVSKQYEGSIAQQGDTVYVSAVDRPTAVRKTVGTGDYDSYSSQKLSTTRVSVAADTIIEAGYVIENLAMLQSQIGAQDSAIRQGLFEALEIELNNYLYSKVAPSTSSPDHSIASVTDFNATQLGSVRVLASQAKWGQNQRWLLADPVYFQDLLNATTLTSGDYAANDAPVIGGKFVLQRFGFNIVEDNSAGLLAGVSASGVATQDCALAMIPDWLLFVMQQGVTFKLSDLHSQSKRGFLLTAEMLVGASLGIEGANKHIEIYNT
jgi:hypothetical protein